MLDMQMIEWPVLAGLSAHAALRVPPWRGESINGRTILVHALDAPTDALFGFRYVPQLASRGADVIIQVERAQVALLGRMGGVRLAIDQAAPTPPADYAVPFQALGSLVEGDTDPRLVSNPNCVNPNFANPYLRADRSRVHHWQQQFAPDASHTVERVLLCFGEPGSTNPHESIPLTALTPLFESSEINWIVLESALTSWELNALRRHPSVTIVATADLDDVAGLIKAVDRVASIDSVVGHLAGALGAPGWALLSATPNWPWLRTRRGSSHYPTLETIRQARVGDWQDVVAVISTALAPYAV